MKEPNAPIQTTARDAIANCLLMGRGMYPSPEDWADAVLKRLAYEGFVVVPRDPTDKVLTAGWPYSPNINEAWEAMIDAALKEQVP